jgi:hypothetical protein
VADEDHPLGADLPTDLFEVPYVTPEGVVSRVIEPRRTPAAHQIVDVNVEALARKVSEIAHVTPHIRDAGAAVQEDHGLRTSLALSRDAHVGKPGAGRKLPEALASHGRRQKLLVTHRTEDR